MTYIQLEAGTTLVDGLTKPNDPMGAVLEIVWNSLDADAGHVYVELLRNEADGVTGVSIRDDGHGMSSEDARTYFKRVGDSWKRGARTSQGENRPLHGKAGQGRLRAFALGKEISWTTVAVDATGARVRTNIHAKATAKDGFDCSDPQPVSDATGTVFEATGRGSLNILDNDKSRARLTRELAPYLMVHPGIEVRYDNEIVSPHDHIEHDTDFDLTWDFQGCHEVAILRVIEWKSGSDRSLLLCDADGLPVEEAAIRLPAPDFQYTAYVMWAAMPEHRSDWMITDLEQDTSLVGGLLARVIQTLNDHFDARRGQRRRQLVQEWKDQNVYPYDGEAQTEEQKVERVTFDVIATSIRRHIPKKNSKQQRLTLGLLRESLQQRPTDVSSLLDQFLDLPEDERQQLDRLLKRTGLSRVIQASSSVSNRLEFLAALELMVYDPEANKLVGERDHLHKILENELWIFGEQFNQMISERGLTAALDRHLEILGSHRTDKSVVKRLDGSSGRLDLMLSAAATEHDRNRHLVVELKAPRVRATVTELTQIQSYATAVVADSRFANSATVWDFWLVVADLDEYVKQVATQRDRPRGLVLEPDSQHSPETRVRVWVRTWSEIIEDCRRRLAFFQERLQHDPSLDEARAYLAREHADVIPEGLFPEDQDGQYAGQKTGE